MPATPSPLAPDPPIPKRDFQSEIILALDAIYDGGRNRVTMREHEVFGLLSHLHVSLPLLFYGMTAYSAGPGRSNGGHADLGAQYSSMGVSPALCSLHNMSSTDDCSQMYFTKQVEYITRYIDTYGHIIDQYGARAALKFHFGVSNTSSIKQVRLTVRDC
jgi:hypothetical protein